MNYLKQTDQDLEVDGVSVTAIAQAQGTPCYIYSHAALVENWRLFDQAFAAQKHRLCYSVKANSNLAVLNTFAQLNSGFDIVSIGELERVIAAKGEASGIIFSGVAKQATEIERALQLNIGCFNVESAYELELIAQIAQNYNLKAPVALRINPDVDAKSHPFIATGLKDNKFGIPMDQALTLYRKAADHPHLNVIGIACHIGSQITQLAPFEDAFARVFSLVATLKSQGIILQQVDIGGGLGVHYQNETPPTHKAYAQTILKHCQDPQLTLIIEPGRAIVANAGILVTRVLQLKKTEHKHFCIVDAAMNDLLRPALYDAWHEMVPVTPRLDTPVVYDVVGPICESSDFLGKERTLSIKNNDLLAIMSTGAYAFTMSSNYNSRPRACEIMVKNGTFHVIRSRETIPELFAKESLC